MKRWSRSQVKFMFYDNDNFAVNNWSHYTIDILSIHVRRNRFTIDLQTRNEQKAKKEEILRIHAIFILSFLYRCAIEMRYWENHCFERNKAMLLNVFLSLVARMLSATELICFISIDHHARGKKKTHQNPFVYPWTSIEMLWCVCRVHWAVRAGQARPQNL